MATEFNFGLSAQMMLFADDEQRKLASQVLPIAEVLDRVKKLSLASKENDKKRLSASVMFTLGDLSAMNAIVKLATNTTEFNALAIVDTEGNYKTDQDATVKAAVVAVTKITDNPNDNAVIKTANETAAVNKACLIVLGLENLATDTTVLYTTKESKNIFTQNGQNLLEFIALSKNTTALNKVTNIYAEVDKLQQLDNDKKLLLDSYKTLDKQFEDFKGTEDLNLVEIAKDIDKTKIESVAPVRIKKQTLVKAEDLKISVSMAKWIPEMTTIEQLSFDFKEKTGAFEIIIKPGKDFPTNTKPSIFYLNRASMLIERKLAPEVT